MKNKIIILNILRFYGLLFVQVLIINNIGLPVLINPYIYPIFILLLPFEIAHWTLMLLAFLLGLGVDIFMNTLGIHAAAAVLTAFLRPYVINLLTPTGGYEIDDRPTIKDMGMSWFLPYTGILIFVHHFAIMFLEVLSFTQILFTLSKIALSALVAFILVILYQLIFHPKR